MQSVVLDTLHHLQTEISFATTTSVAHLAKDILEPLPVVNPKANHLMEIEKLSSIFICSTGLVYWMRHRRLISTKMVKSNGKTSVVYHRAKYSKFWGVLLNSIGLSLYTNSWYYLLFGAPLLVQLYLKEEAHNSNK